jgi:monolysocardiolipin acyltransferase
MPKNSFLHRAASTSVIATTGILSKLILSTAQAVDVTGLEGFLRVLDERRDGKKRTRGLLTGSSHLHNLTFLPRS